MHNVGVYVVLGKMYEPLSFILDRDINGWNLEFINNVFCLKSDLEI